MGLSGSTKTQTYTPSPQQAQAASTLSGVYNASAGNTQGIANQLSGLVPGMTTTAASTSQGVGAASNYYQNVLDGQYLAAGNPYISGIVNTTNNNITDRVNGAFSAAGRTGSGANTYALAKALGENENSLQYQNYNDQLARMDGAAAGAGSLNSSTLGSLMSLGTTASGLPLSAASAYASGIANLKMDGTTTSTSTPSTMDQITKGIQLGSILFSDRRLKIDIRRVGEERDGLGIYDYRYVWGGPMQRGVMADEVARLRPWALGPLVGGYATVDYGKL